MKARHGVVASLLLAGGALAALGGTAGAQEHATATFAGGCFWCMQPPFEKLAGVVSTTVGYTGGHTKNPTYEEVSAGGTGHAESVEIVYDPGKIGYAKLLDVVWHNVDPLRPEAPFCDHGHQYRTAIFYHDDTQRRLAEESKQRLAQRFGRPIATEIVAATTFYPAEEYHQRYHEKNPVRYKFYRWNCGRDARLKELWGDEAPAAEAQSMPTKGWNPVTFKKPDDPALRKSLDPMQYKVTQQEGTEPPFHNEYWDNHRPGIYVDVVSGEPVFSSLDKYESGTGWPSFTRPLEPGNIREREDRRLFTSRTEIRSAHADSHLGPVFDAGPAPAHTLVLEVGKPITQARSELAGLLPRIDFFLAEVEGALADEVVLASPADRLEERIRREPLGVVANVSAWNYPWYVGANVFLPALLTGNAVLYKPSELATLTGLAIAELLHEAGIPADVFQALVGGGSVGALLLEEPVDAVCFTGSHATGVKVAAAVAPRLVKVQLELGGKDPAYVCDDVDAAAAAAAVADGAFYNAGQSCCAVERAYVHERVWARFVDAFVETVRGWVAGDPLDARTYIGPLARREAALGLLEAQVADAVSRGARVLTGGRRLDRPGFFFAPTVLVDVDHTMRVLREETFGPPGGPARVGSDAEAVPPMHDTDYGLTAAVYTPDRARAERLLAWVNAGTAYWNCCDRVSPRLPWSGRGASGLGVTLAREGIAAFVRPKAWHLRGG